MKMRQEVISGSFLLKGFPWILQQLPHSSEGCGQQGLHGESGVGRDNELTDFPGAGLGDHQGHGWIVYPSAGLRGSFLGCLCLPGGCGGMVITGLTEGCSSGG